MTVLASYAVLGAIVGILAGLLGVGGGLIIVPVLVYLWQSQGLAGDQLVQELFFVISFEDPDGHIQFSSAFPVDLLHEKPFIDQSRNYLGLQVVKQRLTLCIFKKIVPINF